jgi:hypothetical protein
MEKERQDPGQDLRNQGTQGGAAGRIGDQFSHKRVRPVSNETEADAEPPGMDPMLSDPGEPHKDIKSHERVGQHSEDRVRSGTQQEFGKTGRDTQNKPLLGEDLEFQQEPLLGEDEESQEHPLLGEQTVSMENEKEEQARRKIEEERRRSSQKKPAA